MYQILIPKNSNLLIFQNQRFKLGDYSKLPDLLELGDNYANDQFALEGINYFTCRISLVLKDENDLDLLNCFGLKNVDTNEILLFGCYSVEFNSADKTNITLNLLLDIFSKEFLSNYKVSGIVNYSTLPECRYYYNNGKLVYDKSNMLYDEGFKFPLTNGTTKEILDLSSQAKGNAFIVKSSDVYADKGDDQIDNRSVYCWGYLAGNQVTQTGKGYSFALAYITYRTEESNNYSDVNLATDNIIKPFEYLFGYAYLIYGFDDKAIDFTPNTDELSSVTLTYGDDTLFFPSIKNALIMNYETEGFVYESFKNDNAQVTLNTDINISIRTRDNYYCMVGGNNDVQNGFDNNQFFIYTKDKKCLMIWDFDRDKNKLAEGMITHIENNTIYIDDLVREIYQASNYSYNDQHLYTNGYIDIEILDLIIDEGGIDPEKDDSNAYPCYKLVWNIGYPYFYYTSGQDKAIFQVEDLALMTDYQVQTTYKFDISDDYDIKLTMSSLYNRLVVFSEFFNVELTSYDTVNSSQYMNLYFSEMLTFDYSNKLCISIKDVDNDFNPYNITTDIYSYSMTKSDDFTNFLLTNSSQYMVSSNYALNMQQQTNNMAQIMNDQANANLGMSVISGIANTALSALIGTSKFGLAGGIASGVSSGITSISGAMNAGFNQAETQIQQQMNILSADNAVNQLNAKRQDMQSNFQVMSTNSTLQYLQNYTINSGNLNGKKTTINVLSQTLSDSIKDKINGFFKLYGGKNGNQYEFDSSVKKSPKFDYIQMDNIFISGCPKIGIDMIANIFKQGLGLINDETLTDINTLDFKENILYE